MKCPLSNFVVESEDKDEKTLLLDCLEKECAWWSHDIEACDPANLSRKFDTLVFTLRDIARELTMLRPNR